MAAEDQVDIALQEDNVFRRNRRLVAFDMDSTLIQAEVIDELAKAAGSGEIVSRITESAMRGEIDFKESLRQRLATLKGLDESVMEDIARKLPITEGAERLISNLKSSATNSHHLPVDSPISGRNCRKSWVWITSTPTALKSRKAS